MRAVSPVVVIVFLLAACATAPTPVPEAGTENEPTTTAAPQARQAPQPVDNADEQWVVRAARPTGKKHGTAPIYRKEVISKPFTIDRIYKSMQGPLGYVDLALGNPELPPELL